MLTNQATSPVQTVITNKASRTEPNNTIHAGQTCHVQPHDWTEAQRTTQQTFLQRSFGIGPRAYA